MSKWLKCKGMQFLNLQLLRSRVAIERSQPPVWCPKTDVQFRHLWCSTDCLNSLAEWLSCCCGVWYKVTSEGHESVNHHADKVLFDELQHALDVCDFSSDEKKVCITSSTSATCYTCHGSICRSNVNHIFIHRSVCALHYITLHFLTWPK